MNPSSSMKSRLNRISNWEALTKDSHYSPRELARLCNVSLRQLERYFHEAWGTGVKARLTEMRLREALELLSREECVKAVSNALHYKQVSHFSRDFKRCFGVSPASFLCDPTFAVSEFDKKWRQSITQRH